MANDILKGKKKNPKARGTFPIPRDWSQEGKRFGQSIQDALQQLKGEKGDTLDRAVTFKDLIDTGIAKQNFNMTGSGSSFVIGDESNIDGVDTPSTPTGVTASGAFQNILVSWDYPTYAGHSHTEVYVSNSNSFASRTFLAQTTSSVFSHQVGNAATKYYWIRHVNQNDISGAFHNDTPVNSTTSQDVGALMTSLGEDLSGLPGYTTITGLISDGMEVIRSATAPTTRSGGGAIKIDDIWIDTDDGQIYLRNAANNAWVASRDAQLVSDVSSLTTTVNSNTASISTNATAISTETSARTTAINALTATVNGNTSSITTVSNAVANGTSAQAGYGISVDANGAIAGMYIMADSSGSLQNNTSSTNIVFVADQLAIRSSVAAGENADGGSGNVYTPFIVRTSSTTLNGETVPAGVYIKDGYIQNGSIASAKIGSLSVDKLSGTFAELDTVLTGQLSADSITVDGVTLDTDGSGNLIIRDGGVGDDQLANFSAAKITTGQLDSARVNVDTLNVKFFADVSSKIYSHTGTAVPLSVFGKAIQFDGSYPGDQINNTETTFLAITISNVRNGSQYRVVYSAVLGDTRDGTIQYSFDNSSWTSLTPVVSSDAGTYRTYVFIWDGTLTGMTSGQSQVYWRINWVGGTHNSTYQSMYVTIDNTQ